MKRDYLIKESSIKPRIEPPEWWTPPNHFTILFCDNSWSSCETVQARLRFKRSAKYYWSLESCEFLTDSKGIEFTKEWPIYEFRRLVKVGYLLRMTVEKFTDTVEHIIPII